MPDPQLSEIDISVVIPTHGRPALLTRAIQSALEQTHRNLEVIVVLDGDDQQTAHALNSIDDSRLSLIITSSKVGGAEARNTGARAARGRYVALLDDDDEWLPSKLAKQFALAEEAFLTSGVVVTQYLYRVPGQADETWPGHLPAINEPLSDFLFSSRGGFQTSTYLCPRKLLLAVPFTMGLKKHQDWDWFLRLASLENFSLLIVPEPLSIYWVPLRSRSSVSAKLDWAFSVAWARSMRQYITRKAYSTFLVKICLRAALIQKAKPREVLGLISESIFVGRPDALLVAEAVASLLIPESLRLRLRYGLIHLRARLDFSLTARLPKKGSL